METPNGNNVQSPHIDFTEEEDLHGNFFSYIIPLTDQGCYIFVWPVFAHLRKNKIAGSLVYIAYGKGFLIPSDIVHDGGISLDGTHPRVGLHVTRNMCHALSTCYSTRTSKSINKVKYDFRPWYFVKEVNHDIGFHIDHSVKDVDVSFILNV